MEQWADFVSDPHPMDREDKLAFLEQEEEEGCLFLAYNHPDWWEGSEVGPLIKRVGQASSDFVELCDELWGDSEVTGLLPTLYYKHGYRMAEVCVDELVGTPAEESAHEYREACAAVKAVVNRWKTCKACEDRIWKDS